MATDAEIHKALTLLAAAYPRFDLPEATIKVYQRLLADLDFDLLKAATLQCATLCKFFPTVAEIRDAAVELSTMAEGIPSDIEAWGEINREIQRVHHDGRPEFSHPLIEQIVRDLGWRSLCLSDNQIADRARFMDAYEKNLKVSRRRRQMLPEVTGIVDKRLEDRRASIKQLSMVMDPPALPAETAEVVPMPDHVRENMSRLFQRTNVRGA